MSIEDVCMKVSAVSLHPEADSKVDVLCTICL